jgi:hypothetical protein
MELIDVLREALHRKPELAAGRLLLARELFAVGRRSQSLAELRQIRDVDPSEAVGMYVLMGKRLTNPPLGMFGEPAGGSELGVFGPGSTTHAWEDIEQVSLCRHTQASAGLDD